MQKTRNPVSRIFRSGRYWAEPVTPVCRAGPALDRGPAASSAFAGVRARRRRGPAGARKHGGTAQPRERCRQLPGTDVCRQLPVQLQTLFLVCIGLATGSPSERYIAAKRNAGLSPRTLHSHMNVLSGILRSAVKARRVSANPVGYVDRPSVPRRRWWILSPQEIDRVERASGS